MNEVKCDKLRGCIAIFKIKIFCQPGIQDGQSAWLLYNDETLQCFCGLDHGFIRETISFPSDEWMLPSASISLSDTECFDAYNMTSHMKQSRNEFMSFAPYRWDGERINT
jgi:hypothetical protein